MTALAWRLTRLGGRGALLSTGLTALAVAVATLLLQFAVASNFAFAERAERTEWRDPAAAETGSALFASAVDFYGGDEITRVDLASLDGDAPVPPGLEAFPAPGEVWVSPALAALLDGVPEEDFIDRYEGRIAGVLGREALAHDGEMLAVVGREADSPAMTVERTNMDMVSPRAIDGFDEGEPSMVSGFYRMVAVLATVLMAVPVSVFGAAAARLTVARRDERLATLRLIGATPGQVVRLTLIETVLAAVAGSVAGTALWMASTPLFARIPIDGGPWYVADLWGGAPWMAAVAAAVPVLVALSAVVGLRSVVISPLGVARRVRPKGLKAVRLLVFAVAAVAFLVVSQMLGGGGMLAAAIALMLFAATIAALNLLGPWVVQQLGKLLANTARGPARMLAARRLTDDPKAAWRAVSGVVLAGFIAGSVALFPMFQSDTDPAATETVTATVAGEDAEARAAEARAALEGLAEVELIERENDLDPARSESAVSATTSGADVEHVRSILTATLAGDPPEREVDNTLMSNRLVESVRVGVTVVLSVVFATAAVSAGISAIGSVLDRRKTYRLLHLSGTPQRVLDQARRQETILPLAFLGGASVLCGMGLTSPLIGVMGLDVSGVVILVVTLTVGTAAVIGAGAASRPLLRSVMNDVSPRPD
ncbi:MAG TPA: FtsX-like permease family protein [Glycomyces sp.]|nr:FtsX-like permease family protein [Glycomyces sp.]